MKNFGSLVIGIILFFAAFGLLWWNEGNSAKKINIANYTNKNAIEVSSNSVQRDNDNKLIATNGSAQTSSTLSDEFVNSPNTLVLDRTVQMYQWIENSEDGKTVYKKEWSDIEQNSDDFEDKSHKNPKFTIVSKEYVASNATLGQYDLSEKQIGLIYPQKEFSNLAEKSGYEIINNQYYKGNNIESPEVGDILISYNYAPSGSPVSIIGEQKNDNTIVSFIHKKLGKIYIQYDGKMTKDEMLEKYRSNNKILTLILRFAGWLLMFIGLKLFFEPLMSILNFVPVLGKLADTATTFILALITFILSLFTISIAWFAYRPLLSLSLIAIGGGIAFFVKKKLSQFNNKIIN